MFSQTTFLLVFGLGAICMLLGFVLVLRGVGAADSESAIKLLGLEVRASRVGPGVLFALFGLVLVVTAISKQPTEGRPAATPAAATPAPAPASQQPASTFAPAPAPVPVSEGPPAAVASAPSPPSDPGAVQHAREAEMVGRFLAEVATGVCDERLLGPAPLMDCQQHVNLIQPRVASMGPVQNVAFMGSVASPFGVADRFMVQHAGGAATWTGVLGPDGRFAILVSP